MINLINVLDTKPVGVFVKEQNEYSIYAKQWRTEWTKQYRKQFMVRLSPSDSRSMFSTYGGCMLYGQVASIDWLI